MIQRILVLVFVLSGIVFLPQYDAQANVKDEARSAQIGYKRSIEKTDDMIIFQRDRSAIFRGKDLERAVDDTMRRIRQAQRAVKTQRESLFQQWKRESERRAQVSSDWTNRMLKVNHSQRMYKDRMLDNKIKADQNRAKQQELKRLTEERIRMTKEKVLNMNRRIQEATR